MTRINLIDPKLLLDQHLLAEIKEILQLCGSLRKTLSSKNGLQIHRIPEEFTLNTGHVYFFYDKGLYLCNRFNSLKQEMTNRGFNTSKEFPKGAWSEDLLGNWAPKEADYEIIKERILSRIEKKPEWYRYYGKPIDLEKVRKLYA
jgi:deoxyribonuclease (pyrimidine dimer)